MLINVNTKYQDRLLIVFLLSDVWCRRPPPRH